MVKKLCTLLISFGIMLSCKVQKSLPQATLEINPPKDTTLMTRDSLSIPADTLLVAQDSVEIGMHRVLKDTVTIIGVGDIMMGTNFPHEGYLPPNDGKGLLKEVKEILNNADVTFGNLEGVVLDTGGTQKYCRNPKICYLFRSPEHYMENLVEAGFDVVSMANNHAGDFGNEGRKSTMSVLDSAGLYHAGLFSTPYITFQFEGMKYGFAAFAPNTGTMSINHISEAKKIIQHLDSINDIVIVSFHGGAEGSKHTHVTRENEIFYGENRGNVYLFAHEMIDSGADVIFGHGPHVTRAVEVYNNRFIAYSLGNFCTYARFNLQGDNGLAPIIKVFINSEGIFYKAHITPIIQTSPGGPMIDPQKRVIRRIQELTKKDFPEVPLSIDDTGIITYIQN